METLSHSWQQEAAEAFADSERLTRGSFASRLLPRLSAVEPLRSSLLPMAEVARQRHRLVPQVARSCERINVLSREILKIFVFTSVQRSSTNDNWPVVVVVVVV